MRGGPSWLGSPVPALEFLTTLRVRRVSEWVPERSAEAIARSRWAFPLVGLLIGLGLFGIERGGRELAPPEAVAAVVVLGWVVLSGGLHLDGLADASDGLFGGRDRASRLAIMRDVQVGSWGVIALGMVLIAKFAMVASLAEEGRFAALGLAPVVGRGVVVGVMTATPYARASGLGQAMHRPASLGLSALGPALVALAVSVAVAGIVLDVEGLVVVVWAVVVAAGASAYAWRKLGGLTGDVDGAVVELVEVAVLLAVVVGFEQGWLSALLWEGS